MTGYRADSRSTARARSSEPPSETMLSDSTWVSRYPPGLGVPSQEVACPGGSHHRMRKTRDCPSAAQDTGDREHLARPEEQAGLVPYRALAGPQVDHDDLVRVARAEGGHAVAAVDGECEPRAIRGDGQVPPCLQAGGLVGDQSALDHGQRGDRAGAGEAEAENPDLLVTEVGRGCLVLDVEGSVIGGGRQRLVVERSARRRLWAGRTVAITAPVSALCTSIGCSGRRRRFARSNWAWPAGWRAAGFRSRAWSRR